MYRAALEFILGFRLQGTRLRVEPCVPRWRREVETDFRHSSARYRVTVENPFGLSRGVARVETDGETIEGRWVEVKDKGGLHTVLRRPRRDGRAAPGPGAREGGRKAAVKRPATQNS